MYLLVSLCIVMSASRALTVSPPVPECESLTSEDRAKLESEVVTSLDDSEGTGEFIALYAPKQVVEKDPNTCVRIHRKVENDEVHKSVQIKSSWFPEEKTMNTTLQKASGGSYIVRNHESKIEGRVYILYSGHGVAAPVMCWLRSDQSMPHTLKAVHSIVVRKEALIPPIAEVVQIAIEEAKSKLDDVASVLGEVTRIENPCQLH